MAGAKKRVEDAAQVAGEKKDTNPQVFNPLGAFEMTH